MKPIERGEVLDLADYETVRDRFRSRVIGEKRQRRVVLGSKASVVFENRDTVLLQIQEMLRTERITRPAAVMHEIETYNELLPGPDEVSCTLMIEIADKAERDEFLRAARGLESHVWLVAAPRRIPARTISHGAPAETWADAPADRTTAVHYLKFLLPSDLAERYRAPADGRDRASGVALEIDHPAYAAHADLSAETLSALREDLRTT
jgi:hypothetical protein